MAQMSAAVIIMMQNARLMQSYRRGGPPSEDKPPGGCFMAFLTVLVLAISAGAIAYIECNR